MSGRGLPVAVALAALCHAPFSLAQGRDAASAEALFREGRRLIKNGDYDAACPKFEESHRLDPGVGTLINLAECDEHFGRLATAWQHWQEIVDQLAFAPDKRKDFAKQRVEALDSLVPRLRVTLADGAPASTKVERDGIALGRASLGVDMPVDPGKHVVVAKASGREPRRYRVSLEIGERYELAVEPGERAEEESEASEPAPREARPDTGAGSGNDLAYVALGAGLLGIGAGIGFGLAAKGARSEAEELCKETGGVRRCPREAEDALDRDGRFSTFADVGFVVGAIATGIGVYLLVSSGDEAKASPAKESARLTARARRGGGEVRLEASF